MKRNLFICWIFLLITFKSLAQQSPPVTNEPVIKHEPHYWKTQKETDYWKTHRTLKTTAWVSLGVGLATTLVGVAATIASHDTGKKTEADWIAASGLTLMVGSVPLFIISHHYKKKAASVALGSQHTFIPQHGGFRQTYQPAIILTIPL